MTFSLLVPNILLGTLFSNTLNLCASLSVRDQVSHQYKTTGETMVIHILIFMKEQFSIENEESSSTRKKAYNTGHVFTPTRGSAIAEHISFFTQLQWKQNEVKVLYICTPVLAV
jgi:polysaccharide pyruvyl transferase WcaK-like protein